MPDGIGGEQIAPLTRLFHLADMVEVHHRSDGLDAAVEVARSRRGKQFDPKLVEGGVLIIGDYGHYRGQRQAVDEYFAEIGEKPLLHRIDYSCRVIVRPSKPSL